MSTTLMPQDLEETTSSTQETQEAAQEANGTEKTWAIIAHLSACMQLGVLSTNYLTAALLAVAGPALVWMLKKNEMPLVNTQGKEAINFNLTLLLVGVVPYLIKDSVVVLFAVSTQVIFFAWLAFAIVATLNVSAGKAFRYPISLRLLR